MDQKSLDVWIKKRILSFIFFLKSSSTKLCFSEFVHEKKDFI